MLNEFFRYKLLSVLLLLGVCTSCSAETASTVLTENTSSVKDDTLIKQPDPLFCNADVKTGADRTEAYFELLRGKKVGVVGNQSSMLNETHLVDTLLKSGISVIKVFSPEHGFRGDADAGEKVESGVDAITGIPVISLYGKNKKPTPEQLADIDILVFDIQDVGARFYTYISTLHYVMEAAAENSKPIIVLDRPNPNGHYVDGPVLNTKFKSFVGMHPVPVVHGMSIGEYAGMINGEGWLSNQVKCDLTVIPCTGWDHTKFYELPIAPSPNLKTMRAIYLYPSLCFFEGTVVSIGRGTDLPFEVIGHPKMEVDVLEKLYSFKPMPNEASAHPVLEGQTCYGYNLSTIDIQEIREKKKLDLSYLLEFYKKLNMGTSYFLSTNFINNLAGTDELKAQILAGKTLAEIEASWQEDLERFREMRKGYLIYEE
ncbi:MAG: DUF1343 domain-containing protein [Crocinitomicaceae bacterium]|nr:DUF1343 domain-containing protein [Crocinitomicaceae bacterium]MBK8926232.1 DUF1343 domain-containing protein [Crocinitomicaceae bacterium]